MRILGRADDIIKVGGSKVSLPGLADAARSVPGVSDTAALAVDDAEWGARPVLVIVGSADDADVRAAVLASAGPTRLVITHLDSLPYLPNGKIDRMALRDIITSTGPR
jgi:acyl-CoA synthetase (AMP-forming)/AMP-acid ligase II